MTEKNRPNQIAKTLSFREEAMRDILQHLATHGAKNYKPIIEKYTLLGAAEVTIYKWIRTARKMDAPAVSLDAARALVANRMIGDEIEQPSLEKIASQLPVAPSPAYVAKNGEDGMRNLDILTELRSVQADAMMLREYSVKIVKNPETDEEREAIKNPVFFERQMQRRLGIIDTALKAMSEVWNLRTMQTFYETVIQEIGRADPDTQRRIMVRLSALNSKSGMTVDFESRV